MEKILITGKSGFVGARMALPGALPAKEILCPTHGEMDIGDYDSVMRYFDAHRPDAVVHSAAISDIGECEQDPEKSMRVNVMGTVNMAKACREVGAKLLFMSTDQVYTGCGGADPIPEDAPLAPTNVYAVHKLEAENRMLDILPDSCALRLTWMFDMPVRHQVSKGLVLNCIQALMRNEPLRLCNNDHRGMTYVREVVENIPAMLKAPGGVYNYGSETCGSTYETFCKTFEALGAAHRIEELLSSFSANGEPRNLLMDTKKAQAVGCVFSETIEGVKRLLREYPL